MQVLSAQGQKYEAQESIMDVVCFVQDRGLLINQSKSNHIVDEYIQGLRIRGVDFEVQYLKPDEFRQEVVKMEKASSTLDETQAQRAAIALIQKGKDLGTSDIHLMVDAVNSKTEIWMRILGDMELIEGDHDDKYGVSICRSMSLLTDSKGGQAAEFHPDQEMSARIGNHSKLPDGLFGVRLENIPTNSGNRMVMRLLYDNTGRGDHSLHALGFTRPQEAVFNFFRKSVHGMVLFTGPTGSGKSTTMHSNIILYRDENEGKKSICTIEDPVEMKIDGASQTEIGYCETPEERQVEFVKKLSSILRGDPDLIMTGEIRDEPTATLSLRASMTGHQVLSTLHANTVIGALYRMVDLGVPENLVFDPNNIVGVVSQRLVRVLCEECKVPFKDRMHKFNDHDLNRIMSTKVEPNQTYLIGDGCECCGGRGVTTRTIVGQVIKTDMKLMNYLRNKETEKAIAHIRDAIKAQSIIDVTIEKINQGLVDPFDAEKTIGLLNMERMEHDSTIEMSEIEQSVGSGGSE